MVKFNAAGEYQGQFGDEDFYTPHSLALAEELDIICVADRDNRRSVHQINIRRRQKTLFGKVVQLSRLNEYEILLPDLNVHFFSVSFSRNGLV